MGLGLAAFFQCINIWYKLIDVWTKLHWVAFLCIYDCSHFAKITLDFQRMPGAGIYFNKKIWYTDIHQTLRIKKTSFYPLPISPDWCIINNDYKCSIRKWKVVTYVLVHVGEMISRVYTLIEVVVVHHQRKHNEILCRSTEEQKTS